MQRSQPAVSSLSLDEIRRPVEADLIAVNTSIEANLTSQVPLIDQISHYLINSGGKRLRPVISLLVARALGHEQQKHIDVATIVEFIHTATLLHDDVVDASLMRRGQQTAHAVYGTEASVLVGDFLYSRAFQIMVALSSMPVMRVMANTTNTIAEGEVIQIFHRGDPAISQIQYMDMISAKTAKLFEGACICAAIIADADPNTQKEMGQFGFSLGIAYQLVDDVLDYLGSPDLIGKNIGDDLAEGKPTLPIIYAIRNGTPVQREFLHKTIENKDTTAINDVVDIVKNTKGIEYTQNLAWEKIDQARSKLDFLSSSTFKSALLDLCDFAISRQY